MANAMDMMNRRQPPLQGSGLTGCATFGDLGTTTTITTTTSWIRGAANVA